MNVYKVLGSQCLHFTTSQQAQRRQTEAVILRGKQVSLGFLRYGKMLTYAPQTWYAEKIVSKPCLQLPSFCKTRAVRNICLSWSVCIRITVAMITSVTT